MSALCLPARSLKTQATVWLALIPAAWSQTRFVSTSVWASGGVVSRTVRTHMVQVIEYRKLLQNTLSSVRVFFTMSTPSTVSLDPFFLQLAVRTAGLQSSSHIPVNRIKTPAKLPPPPKLEPAHAQETCPDPMHIIYKPGPHPLPIAVEFVVFFYESRTSWHQKMLVLGLWAVVVTTGEWRGLSGSV